MAAAEARSSALASLRDEQKPCLRSMVRDEQRPCQGAVAEARALWLTGRVRLGSDLAARALAAELARASEVGGDLARSVLPALAGVEGRLERLLRV